VKALKRIGISLLHMHEHQLVHCDFGTHNIGKFGKRWKLLGVGGSVPIGKASNPNRGFYHPPESIVVENKRAAIGKKAVTAVVVSIPARSSYDIWAYGVVFYEAIAGTPLSPYACRGKRPMTSVEVAKIGQWDETSVKKALKQLPPGVDNDAKSLIKKLLHHDPAKRYNSMREVLEHPFFEGTSHSSVSTSTLNTGRSTSESSNVHVPQAVSTQSLSSTSRPEQRRERAKSHRPSVPPRSSPPVKHFSRNLSYVDENAENTENAIHDGSSVISSASKRSKKFGNFRSRFKNSKQMHT